MSIWVNQKTETVLVTQAHHIFPQNEFPEIASFLENIIMLTQTSIFLWHTLKIKHNIKRFSYLCNRQDSKTNG